MEEGAFSFVCVHCTFPPPWNIQMIRALLLGDMVLYESAKCIHGRPHPLKAKSYFNLFVHFRPESEWPLA
jgi:hypothetical protein